MSISHVCRLRQGAATATRCTEEERKPSEGKGLAQWHTAILGWPALEPAPVPEVVPAAWSLGSWLLSRETTSRAGQCWVWGVVLTLYSCVACGRFLAS